MSAELKPGYLCPTGYKQTDVGVIPEDWESLLIPEITTQFNNAIKIGPFGSALKKEFLVKQGYKIYGQENVYERGMEIGDRYINQEHFNRLKSCEIWPGDFLISMMGTVGKCFVVPKDIDRGIMDSHLLRLRLDQQKIDSRILEQLFRTKLVFDQIKKLSVGGIMEGLSSKIIRNIRIPVPPTKAEQEAIAETLSDADALIESLEQLIAKKRHIKQGTMQELLTGKKRLPGFNGKWETRKLGEVITHCASGATPYRGRPEFYKGDIKWITSGELNYNVITDTLEHISKEAVEKTNLKIHPVGTFLMAITGLEAAGTRGSCGIIGNPATTNQSCMAIYPTTELLSEYLYHYYVYHGDKLALEYCQGTKQQSYTAKLVRILPIDAPPTVDEQTAIAIILSDMDSEIAALETQLAKTKSLKQGMMHNLLTGRIRLIESGKLRMESG